MGISPGTFYYHFKNKEEIIHKIFDRLTFEFDELLDVDFSSVGIMDYVLDIKRIYYKYRSFYCDLSMLVDRDDLFAKRYRENYRNKSKKLYTFTLQLEQRGVLKQFPSDEERYYFVKNQWIFNDFWFLFLKSSGEDNTVLEEIKSFFMFMKPYLSENSCEEFDKMISEKLTGELSYER